MDEGELYLPREAAARLGLPPSTLRTYAAAFGDLLSPGARAGTGRSGRGFAHRRYTRRDLDLLERARTLLDAGLSYQVARAQLAGATFAPALPASRRSRLAGRRGPDRDERRGQPATTTGPRPATGRRAAPDPGLERSLERLGEVGVAVDELRARVERVVEEVRAQRAQIARLGDLAALAREQLEVAVALRQDLAELSARLEESRATIGPSPSRPSPDSGHAPASAPQRPGWLRRLLRRR
jgi:DNA-binding transcriptional MerR regulator